MSLPFDYSDLFEQMARTQLKPWLGSLPDLLARVFSESPHGDLPHWLKVLRELPRIEPAYVDLTADAVRAGTSSDCDVETRMEIEHRLRQLHPWRKGPYRIFDIFIDTEWRSNWKWNRIKDHIQPLAGRVVLDVGSGNGYHCWRIAGSQAQLTIGIDPSLLYMVQFHAIKHFVGTRNVHLLPIGIEDLPPGLNAFDTVFSMGVFYHRRSPFEHLLELRDCLRNGGELVLETLVIAGPEGRVLVPEGRYAKMRNVWFIPTCPTLLSWLRRAGFTNARVVDVTITTSDEQRSTDWMRFQSLSDFLQPQNPQLTVEGLPAPKRAILVARKALR